MKAPKCQYCGLVEWRHVCAKPATNAKPLAPVNATNDESVATNAATNKETPLELLRLTLDQSIPVLSNVRRTKNRRMVGDYNAYQREYMKVWRARKAT